MIGEPFAYAIFLHRNPHTLTFLREHAEAWMRERPECTIVPLYRQPQPTLTDDERQAVKSVVRLLYSTDYDAEFVTLRGLLERMGTNHDAVPAAIARTDADRNRTDKAAIRPGNGAGNTHPMQTTPGECSVPREGT